MQKLTDAASAIAVRNKNPAYYGVSPRDYLDLGHFSIAADKLGVKSTAIKKGKLSQGACLELSGNNNYEVLVDGIGQVLLGKIEADGNRVRLCVGSTGTEQWNRMLGVLRNAEGRAA